MKQKVEKDKQVGLLELRVKNHKTIVEDWAHWDVLYAYTQSGDQSFIDDNVMHTSIAIDGQALILGTGDKPLKNLKKSTIEPELSKCLQQHILSFEAREKPDTSYGLICKTTKGSYLGAVAGVLKSNGQGPSTGSLIHLSSFERPSFRSSLNDTFSEIESSIEERKPSKKFGDDFINIRALGSDANPQNIYFIKVPFLTRSTLFEALEKSLPLWLLFNLCLWIAAIGIFSAMRSSRLKSLQGTHLMKLQLRDLKSKSGSTIVSIANLFENAKSLTQEATGKSWVALFNVQIEMHKGSYSKIQSRSYALSKLNEQITTSDHTLRTAISEDNYLIWIFDDKQSSKSPSQIIKDTLNGYEGKLSNLMRINISAVVACCDAEKLREEINNLILIVLNSPHAKQQHITLVSELGKVEAENIRATQQLHYDIENFITTEDVNYRLEPVYCLNGNTANKEEGMVKDALVYKEILLRLPDSLHSRISVQDFIYSSEKNNTIHYLDRKMLSHALCILAKDPNQNLNIGVNISGRTLTTKSYFDSLMADLKSASLSIRQRVIFEITETAVIEDQDKIRPRLEEIQKLGAKIAIDDFGAGFTSFSQIFAFHINYIKLDLKFAQQIDNPDIDALVDFLMTYCINRSCELILEGMETSEQLEHWRSKGVQSFQGFYFKDFGA